MGFVAGQSIDFLGIARALPDKKQLSGTRPCKTMEAWRPRPAFGAQSQRYVPFRGCLPLHLHECERSERADHCARICANHQG